MNDAKDYALIAAWGRYMCSYGYYITQQQRLAAAEGAPLDALFREESGHWYTFRELSPTSAFNAYLGSVTNAGLI